MWLNSYSVVLVYFLEGDPIQFQKDYYAISEDAVKTAVFSDYGFTFSISSINKI